MFENKVKLFMLFDILGDTVRSGMIQWKVNRERLEDVKDHIMDLIFIAKILERYLSPFVDMSKVINYIIVHDLPEAITGDITKFEGVSEEEIERVTKLAIDYLVENFNDIKDKVSGAVLEKCEQNRGNDDELRSTLTFCVENAFIKSEYYSILFEEFRKK